MAFIKNFRSRRKQVGAPVRISRRSRYTPITYKVGKSETTSKLTWFGRDFIHGVKLGAIDISGLSKEQRMEGFNQFFGIVGEQEYLKAMNTKRINAPVPKGYQAKTRYRKRGKSQTGVLRYDEQAYDLQIGTPKVMKLVDLRYAPRNDDGFDRILRAVDELLIPIRDNRYDQMTIEQRQNYNFVIRKNDQLVTLPEAYNTSLIDFKRLFAEIQIKLKDFNRDKPAAKCREIVILDKLANGSMRRILIQGSRSTRDFDIEQVTENFYHTEGSDVNFNDQGSVVLGVARANRIRMMSHRQGYVAQTLLDRDAGYFPYMLKKEWVEKLGPIMERCGIWSEFNLENYDDNCLLDSIIKSGVFPTDKVVMNDCKTKTCCQEDAVRLYHDIKQIPMDKASMTRAVILFQQCKGDDNVFQLELKISCLKTLVKSGSASFWSQVVGNASFGLSLKSTDIRNGFTEYLRPKKPRTLTGKYMVEETCPQELNTIVEQFYNKQLTKKQAKQNIKALEATLKSQYKTQIAIMNEQLELITRDDVYTRAMKFDRQADRHGNSQIDQARFHLSKVIGNRHVRHTHIAEFSRQTNLKIIENYFDKTLGKFRSRINNKEGQTDLKLGIINQHWIPYFSTGIVDLDHIDSNDSRWYITSCKRKRAQQGNIKGMSSLQLIYKMLEQKDKYFSKIEQENLISSDMSDLIVNDGVHFKDRANVRVLPIKRHPSPYYNEHKLPNWLRKYAENPKQRQSIVALARNDTWMNARPVNREVAANGPTCHLLKRATAAQKLELLEGNAMSNAQKLALAAQFVAGLEKVKEQRDTPIANYWSCDTETKSIFISKAKGYKQLPYSICGVPMRFSTLDDNEFERPMETMSDKDLRDSCVLKVNKDHDALIKSWFDEIASLAKANVDQVTFQNTKLYEVTSGAKSFVFASTIDKGHEKAFNAAMTKATKNKTWLAKTQFYKACFNKDYDIKQIDRSFDTQVELNAFIEGNPHVPRNIVATKESKPADQCLYFFNSRFDFAGIQQAKSFWDNTTQKSIIVDKGSNLVQASFVYSKVKFIMKDFLKMLCNGTSLSKLPKMFDFKAQKEHMVYGLMKPKYLWARHVTVKQLKNVCKDEFLAVKRTVNSQGHIKKTTSFNHEKWTGMMNNIDKWGLWKDGSRKAFDYLEYSNIYLKYDCIVLAQAIDRYRTCTFQTTGQDSLKYLSISSLADGYYRKQSDDHVFELSGSICENLMGFAIGGRVGPSFGKSQTFNCKMKANNPEMTQQHEGGKLVAGDINSLYPSAYKLAGKAKGVPKLLTERELSITPDQLMKQTSEFWLTIEVEQIQSIENAIPVVSESVDGARNWKSFGYQKYGNNQVIKVMHASWESFKRYNPNFKFVRIISGYFCDEGICKKVSIATQKLYTERLRLKALKCSGRQNLIKLLLNSAIGKTVQRFIEYDSKYLQGELEVCATDTELDMKIQIDAMHRTTLLKKCPRVLNLYIAKAFFEQRELQWTFENVARFIDTMVKTDFEKFFMKCKELTRNTIGCLNQYVYDEERGKWVVTVDHARFYLSKNHNKIRSYVVRGKDTIVDVRRSKADYFARPHIGSRVYSISKYLFDMYINILENPLYTDTDSVSAKKEDIQSAVQQYKTDKVSHFRYLDWMFPAESAQSIESYDALLKRFLSTQKSVVKKDSGRVWVEKCPNTMQDLTHIWGKGLGKLLSDWEIGDHSASGVKAAYVAKKLYCILLKDDVEQGKYKYKIRSKGVSEQAVYHFCEQQNDVREEQLSFEGIDSDNHGEDRKVVTSYTEFNPIDLYERLACDQEFKALIDLTAGGKKQLFRYDKDDLYCFIGKQESRTMQNTSRGRRRLDPEYKDPSLPAIKRVRLTSN